MLLHLLSRYRFFIQTMKILKLQGGDTVDRVGIMTTMICHLSTQDRALVLKVAIPQGPDHILTSLTRTVDQKHQRVVALPVKRVRLANPNLVQAEVGLLRDFLASSQL